MKKEICLAMVAAGCALPLFAKIEMGTPFSDGMVLQRGMKVPVWGRVTQGGRERIVSVTFGGQEKSAAVDAVTGRWKVELDPMEASKESRALTVRELTPGFIFDDVEDALEIGDVLVGEVWFASGQSNMECPLWGEETRYRDGKGALMASITRLPFVRFAKNGLQWSVEPTEAKSRGWRRFEPSSLADSRLSALAFYYARELYLALDVPIGIVDASWGGTNIDAWTPRSGYEGCDASIREVADLPVKRDWNAATDTRGPVFGACQQPTVIFNGMVASWTPMATRGVIWYQGCHNFREPQLYRAKLHALYNGWAKEFANPRLRFYLAQLAPWEDSWMGICAAQNQFVAEQGNAAIAVLSDAGNFDDIHPNDKEIVAKRLVVHALKRDYGFDVPEDDSPTLRSAAFAADGTVTMDFAHVRNWYVYAPDRSRDAAFEVLGKDGKWTAAKIVNFRTARDGNGSAVCTDFVDGSRISVRSDAVAAPVGVRYMGRPRTSGTLYNEACLPLGPFEEVKR